VLSKQFVQIDEIDGAVSGFVVNTGSKLILVDTGTGGFWGGNALGHLVANLKKAGYRPEQVDIVLLTHLHADHVGGLATSKGTRVFPRAVVHMAKADSDFWLSEKIAQQAPREAQEFFTLARSSAKPYIAAKKWSPFVGTDEIVPGVTPYPIAGHTPGHTGYLFTSKGQTMLVWGDLVHAAPVQMERPDVGVVFDIDGPTAIKTRQDLLADLAEKGTLVAGEHMPFPSLGRLRKEGAGFVWLPVPYKARP
jgi:glyoxylase-like metal-dependent hydrolase (beta-lactamase superfamily II)